MSPWFFIWISMASSSPVELAAGLFLFEGQLQPDRSPDGNTVLLRGPEGWIVVDSGRGGDHTKDVLRFLARSGAEPRAVINTHWHLDHIGGNARFRTSWPEATSLVVLDDEDLHGNSLPGFPRRRRKPGPVRGFRCQPHAVVDLSSPARLRSPRLLSFPEASGVL